MGAAAELRRAGGAAARELFDAESAAAEHGAHGDATNAEPLTSLTADEPAATFRSAYRQSGDALLLLDQRDLPGRLTIVTCHEPSEVASAIRAGVVNAGPILGEVAAYALLAALSRVASDEISELDQAFRAAANTLRSAAREVRALKVSADRMERRYDELTSGASDGAAPASLAKDLRAEADAITTEAQLAHAALGRAGAAAIAAQGAETVNLLMHGDMGPLSCGLVGTGTAVLQDLVAMGRRVHVWLTEASPSNQGARLAALQLTQADIPHTVLSDTAVGWLLSTRELDGVLLRGDTIAFDGDVVALIGSLNVARLAADAAVPVYIVAPESSFDRDLADAASVLPDLRSAAEALATKPRDAGQSRPAVFGVRLNPVFDAVPRDLVSAYLTETGPQPGGRA
jgi:methylthioribose-1-phosphate isomerase